MLFPSFAVASDAPAPPPPSDWIPAGIEQMGRTALTHTDFTLDRSLLQLSSGLVDGGDPDTRKAIGKLNGLTVHLYHYAAPGMYDPRQLDAIREQYRSAGWKHMVGTQSHDGNPGPAVAPPFGPPGSPMLSPTAPQAHTDLYIKFQGMDVVGMVVMQTTPRNLNVVALSGDLSPVDLLHLRGHFGIPKFGADGFAPTDN